MRRRIRLQLLIFGLMLSAAAAATSGGLFAQTRRIVFRPGDVATAVSGTLGKGRERRFVLGARAGQRLNAKVISDGCVRFSKGGDSVSFRTRAGNNYLTIFNLCGTGGSKFTLRVLII